MPVGLRDRRTWRRRGPPARTLVIGTDARYWHQRALSAPTRVVDMSARYIPLAVSTTPSQCRQPPHNVGNARPCRQPPHNVDNPRPCRQPPHSVDNARPRPCPENAPVRPRTAARRDYAPRVPGGFPREAESTTRCLECPSCPGDALFFVAVGGTKRKMPPRVWELPVPVPASGERPHAPGLAEPLHFRVQTPEGTPARAPGLVPGPASPRLSATPGGTRTRTLIHRTRTAHKGAIPPLCAAPCFLIPFLVRDTEKERGQDPRGTRRTGHSCCTA